MKFDKVAIRKDDKVKVIAGKDKGKIGKVLKVLRKKDRILVEKVNLIKRHTRPNAKNRQGIMETEAPVPWANVMLMCNKCMAATRVAHRLLEDGKKIRTCAKCGEAMESWCRSAEEQQKVSDALEAYNRVFAVDINFQDVQKRVSALQGRR